MTRNPTWRLGALTLALLVTACGGGDDDGPAPEETRPHDERTFNLPSPAETSFDALAVVDGDESVTTTSRWAGVLDGAAYRIEVPADWNGVLVMYAHGYAGDQPALAVQNPALRRHLISNGYAWAASSYSRNYYDVRAGVEDTNALALAFGRIAAENGRTLATPTKRYITGVSMGGHITGAAIEAETQRYARNKVRYDGAVPMCGVMGGPELFNQFAALQVAAQAIVGLPNYPTDKWSDISTTVTSTLFSSFPPAANTIAPAATAQGAAFVSVLRNITGGNRPVFDLGLAFGGSFPSMWGALGGDGTISGILNESVLDTRGYTYVIDGDTAGSADLNARVQVLEPDEDANRLRRDGLRWIPQIAGEFDVPVVSIHTLGDLFVPFSMQQVYARRAADKGSSANLVQRAIRGASHCDFTVAEQAAAFDAMVAWESGGEKPAGDDVLTPETVAAPTYGCSFTIDTLGPDDGAFVQTLRPLVTANAPCTPP